MCLILVLFGKVESVVLRQKWRDIVLRVIVAVSEISQGPLLFVSLDHCSSPALENGMTYLWEENNRKYKPLSIPVDLTSDIYMFFTACDLNIMQALNQSVSMCSHILHIQGVFSMQGNFWRETIASFFGPIYILLFIHNILHSAFLLLRFIKNVFNQWPNICWIITDQSGIFKNVKLQWKCDRMFSPSNNFS